MTLVRRFGLTFDFILLSAVWMHVAPPALRKLMTTLLAPSDRIAISLRLGGPNAAHSMLREDSQ